MSEYKSSFTKLAYVRGIGERLQQRGLVKFASPNVLRHACDTVTDQLLGTEPVKIAGERAFPQQPTFDEVKTIAETLVKMSQYLEGQGKTAADPAAVSIATPDEAYGDLLKKVAESALIGVGSDPKNTLNEAAAASAEAKLEQMRRPEGYAVAGQGNTNFSESQASRIGTEQPQMDLDTKKNPGGSNSVIKSTQAGAKTGSILEALQKLSMPLGATIAGERPEQQNKMENSTAAETQMEAMERPEGYAVVGQGNANMREVTDARLGVEQPHPKQPMDAGTATNSVIEATKAAELRMIADTLLPILPSSMSPDEKIAMVQRVGGLEPSLREPYVREVLWQAR